MGVKLSREEEDMLSGKEGEAKKTAMEVIMSLAESFGSESLIKISSVQAMAHYGSLHEAGLEWLEKLAALGGKCCVPTTQDPASIPFDCWKEEGFDSQYAAKQIKMAEAVKQLGEVLTWSCTPYNVGISPRFGENIAWAESSAVAYANSVIGARTNRTPAGLAICAAITGRIPKERMYLDESRIATVKINIEAEALTMLDYNTIGIMLGRFAGIRVCAFDGMPKDCTSDNLKYLGAAAAASGGVAMYHILGVTPEATGKDPFAGKKPLQEVTWTYDEIKKAEQNLSTSKPGEPDIAVVGCPHYSIWELKMLSDIVKGKKVRPNKEFWVYTPFETHSTAKRMGVAQILEDAGIKVFASSCLVISTFPRDYKTVITDSGKFASYLPSEHSVELIYTSAEECVNSILS